MRRWLFSPVSLIALLTAVVVAVFLGNIRGARGCGRQPTVELIVSVQDAGIIHSLHEEEHLPSEIQAGALVLTIDRPLTIRWSGWGPRRRSDSVVVRNVRIVDTAGSLVRPGFDARIPRDVWAHTMDLIETEFVADRATCAAVEMARARPELPTDYLSLYARWGWTVPGFDWIDFLGWLMVSGTVGFVVAGAGFGLRAVGRARVRLPHVCECGYDCTGVPCPICPECGRDR